MSIDNNLMTNLANFTSYETFREIHQKTLHSTDKLRGIETLIFSYLRPLNPQLPTIEELHTSVVVRDFCGRPLPGSERDEDQALAMRLNHEQRAYLVGMYVLGNPNSFRPIKFIYQEPRRSNSKGMYWVSERYDTVMKGKSMDLMGFHQLRYKVMEWFELDIQLDSALRDPNRIGVVQELLKVESLDLNAPLRFRACDHQSKISQSLPAMFLAVASQNLGAVQLLLQDRRVDLFRSFQGRSILDWSKQKDKTHTITTLLEKVIIEPQKAFISALSEVHGIGEHPVEILGIIGEYFTPWFPMRNREPIPTLPPAFGHSKKSPEKSSCVLL